MKTIVKTAVKSTVNKDNDLSNERNGNHYHINSNDTNDNTDSSNNNKETKNEEMPVAWLTRLLSKILQGGRMPNEWRKSVCFRFLE